MRAQLVGAAGAVERFCFDGSAGAGLAGVYLVDNGFGEGLTHGAWCL
jgi:hypothetical protein